MEPESSSVNITLGSTEPPRNSGTWAGAAFTVQAGNPLTSSAARLKAFRLRLFIETP